MKHLQGIPDRSSPRRQSHWDWRAAANFICGGAGGGLLLWAPVAMERGGDVSALILAGLALVAAGLVCVWFEIGRPWRALNVFRHPATSWMTRESSVAPLLFLAGGAALATGQAFAVWACSLLGGAFLYAQARILAADKGIPAWRHPRCLPLLLATNLAEGAALLGMAAVAWDAPAAAGFLLAPLLIARTVAWRAYLAGLARDGAPAGALASLRAIDSRFVWLGNGAPALLALAGAATAPLLTALAGGAALAAGWWFKTVLVRRAAFTQGFALRHLPVRGRGTAGPGVKPGWEDVRRRA